MSWEIGAAIGSQLIGSLIGAESQRQTNEENKRIAQDNRYFQETMSNSAFQRQMADMKRAGYNPMIATGSGATTPPGATAQLSNPYGDFAKSVGSSVESALAARRLNAELEKLETSKDVDKATVHGIVNKAALDLEQANSARAQQALTNTQNKALQLELPKKSIDSKMAIPDAIMDRALKLSPVHRGNQLPLPTMPKSDKIYGPYN